VETSVMRNELVASGEEVGLKLREAWASSNNNYFVRYAGGQTSVLCATASDFDRLSDRVVLSFYDNRETMPYARRLDSFIKKTCENSRAGLYKVYVKCFRYTKTVHSLTVEPHCSLDPSQACVFIDTETMSSGICAYITDAASEEFSHTQVIRHLAQMVVVLRNIGGLGTKVCTILLWIVSDPQWDLYIAIKSTLTMPSMKRVHKHLAWFRKVLLRHKCCSGAYSYARHKHGYENVQHKIQQICKKCDLTWEPGPDYPAFDYCDEDFMPR
jgi:hypothetical protein